MLGPPSALQERSGLLSSIGTEQIELTASSPTSRTNHKQHDPHTATRPSALLQSGKYLQPRAPPLLAASLHPNSTSPTQSPAPRYSRYALQGPRDEGSCRRAVQLQLTVEEEDGVKQDAAASVTDEIDIDIVMGRGRWHDERDLEHLPYIYEVAVFSSY